MNLHQTKLPDYIEEFVISSSKFSTSCATTISGREIRNADHHIGRHHYSLNGCRLSLEQFNQFNSFFKARSGRRFGFFLKDHLDYQVIDQLQLVKGDKPKITTKKLYPDAIAPYQRLITRPDIATLKFLLEQEEVKFTPVENTNNQFQLQHQFDAEAIIKVSFEFAVPVRFVHDQFFYQLMPDNTIEINQVELIEIIE